MFTKLNVSLNEHGGNGENCVFIFAPNCSSVLGTHCEIFAT